VCVGRVATNCRLVLTECALPSKLLHFGVAACTMQVIVRDFAAVAGMVGDVETTVQVGLTESGTPSVCLTMQAA
jgi:hypothetical protein